MPITPAYTWQESDEEVTVEVVLRNASRNQVDIVSTECFLKVNSSPYLLQIDLYGEVAAKRSAAVVSQTGVTFALHKVTKGLWGRLTAAGEKQELLERRQKSLDAYREAAGKQKEDTRLLKERTNKLVLEKQWALDEAKKQTLERRKAEELQRAQEDLLQWQKGTTEKQAAHALEGSQHTIEENNVDDGRFLNSEKNDAVDDDLVDEDRFIPANKGRAAIVEIDEEEESGKSPQRIPSKDSHASSRENCQTVVKRAPNPGVNLLLTGKAEEKDSAKPGVNLLLTGEAEERVSAKPGVNLLLTGEVEERVSDAPLVVRSSRRLQPVKSDGIADVQHEKPGKENMEQLGVQSHKSVEEKGSFEGGQVAESVPAPNLPPLRKRMVVPVQFTAKELRPNVPARESRLKEIELKKAQSAAADDDAVDISERQPAFLKDKGDAFYRAGDYEGAVAAYSRALEKDPSLALCYSNRSACYLRLGQLDSCVSDCTRAVDLLQRQLEECDDEMDGQDATSESLNGGEEKEIEGLRDPPDAMGQGLQGESDGQVERGGRFDGQAGVHREQSKPSSNIGVLEPALESPEARSTPGLSKDFEREQSEEKGSEVLKGPTEEGTTGDHAAEGGSVEVALPEDGALRRESKIHTSSAENGRANEKGSGQIGRNESLQEKGRGTFLERPRAKPSDRQRVYTALVNALVRRGAARCEQGLLPDAVLDYERALKLDLGNKGIEKDLQAVRDCINPPTQAEWKIRGDGRYREGDIEGAMAAYTRAIECEDPDASVTRACIANRSACYIQLERFHEAETDCSQALELLGERSFAPESEVADGMAVESQACLKLLSRRGMVFGHLKKYGDAIRDLETAVRLAGAMKRVELVQDLERDIALLKKLQEAPSA